MGELFANIDKMDIQEERWKTAEARRKLEEANREIEEANREIEEVRKQAGEDIIRNTVEIYKDCGVSKEEAVLKIMEKFRLSAETAEEKTGLYW